MHTGTQPKNAHRRAAARRTQSQDINSSKTNTDAQQQQAYKDAHKRSSKNTRVRITDNHTCLQHHKAHRHTVAKNVRARTTGEQQKLHRHTASNSTHAHSQQSSNNTYTCTQQQPHWHTAAKSPCTQRQKAHRHTTWGAAKSTRGAAPQGCRGFGARQFPKMQRNFKLFSKGV